jgi:hypothetical protein
MSKLRAGFYLLGEAGGSLQIAQLLPPKVHHIITQELKLILWHLDGAIIIPHAMP